MAKHLPDNRRRFRPFLILLTVSCTCVVAYLCFSSLLQISPASSRKFLPRSSVEEDSASLLQNLVGEDGTGCCRGSQHTELWSEAVNWGSDFLIDSTQECCEACKANPRCNSWVYCADRGKCGSNYRQCWLKRQKDPLNPEIHDSSQHNPWTSGILFDKDAGVVGLEIASGTMSGEVIHIKLLPDCSPTSVLHILELVKLTRCSGCRFYRAEGRGHMWDPIGGHISKMSTGPPYAVVQGALEAKHVPFKKISKEYTPAIRRGMVGWVGDGPDFFISLADHYEWPRKHTVFATVLEDDMPLVESLTDLPTTTTTWGKVAVQVLDKPVNVKVQRMTKP